MQRQAQPASPPWGRPYTLPAPYTFARPRRGHRWHIVGRQPGEALECGHEPRQPLDPARINYTSRLSADQHCSICVAVVEYRKRGR